VKRSAPSALRSHRTPNLRIQDGEKEYLLCWKCEKKALDSLSPKQEQKVAKFIEQNLDEFAESEIARAMTYDVHHSGKAAFKPKKRKGNI